MQLKIVEKIIAILGLLIFRIEKNIVQIIPARQPAITSTAVAVEIVLTMLFQKLKNNNFIR